MQITIESVKPLEKSMALKAGGIEYLAKKDSGLAVGMTIETEPELSDYNGKTYRWIKKYKAVNRSTQAPTSSPTAQPAGAPIWSNFVSNQVAHAIQAGLITSPDQVKLWAAASKQAFVELLA
jgi:hypothetical protein